MNPSIDSSRAEPNPDDTRRAQINQPPAKTSAQRSDPPRDHQLEQIVKLPPRDIERVDPVTPECSGKHSAPGQPIEESYNKDGAIPVHHTIPTPRGALGRFFDSLREIHAEAQAEQCGLSAEAFKHHRQEPHRATVQSGEIVDNIRSDHPQRVSPLGKAIDFFNDRFPIAQDLRALVSDLALNPSNAGGASVYWKTLGWNLVTVGFGIAYGGAVGLACASAPILAAEIVPLPDLVKWPLAGLAGLWGLATHYRHTAEENVRNMQRELGDNYKHTFRGRKQD